MSSLLSRTSRSDPAVLITRSSGASGSVEPDHKRFVREMNYRAADEALAAAEAHEKLDGPYKGFLSVFAKTKKKDYAVVNVYGTNKTACVNRRALGPDVGVGNEVYLYTRRVFHEDLHMGFVLGGACLTLLAKKAY